MQKNTSLKKVALFGLILSNVLTLSAQSYWKKVEKSTLANKTITLETPAKAEAYQLNFSQFELALQNAPKRFSQSHSNVLVTLPVVNGVLEQFEVFESSVFHPDLAAKYPEIKSYFGKSTTTGNIVRFSVSPQKGLSSMLIRLNKQTVFIEPFQNDITHYLVYSRNAQDVKQHTFNCLTDDVPLDFKKIKNSTPNKDANDQTLRTFLTAVSASGEYTVWHGGTKVLAMAAINATMTRVNGIYETDFGITMQLVANNDDVVYTNPNTDPYTNSLNSQLQSTLSSVIGEPNYHVGHLLHQGSNNGNAGCIGCVCVNNQKGSGYSSHSSPQGDYFDVDYVAHEFGHQFGANHSWTMNGSEGTGAQMEPGSGSTIMGYAGITGASDVQSHSDDYFHFFNIQQVTTNVASKSCYTSTAIVNTPPTANAGADYTIPKGTAFILEGSGSDPDVDSLSFCWEQADVGFNSQTSVSNTSTGSPAFRSMPPTTSPNRYMPQLSAVVAGNLTTQWETVANVGRTMNFALTARDNLSGGGQNKIDEMIVTVDGNSGPFTVTSQNTAVTWNEGSTETITWNVAGTNAGAVNTPNVDIFLSQDGGFTYPITLATNVPNNGTANVTVPTGSATNNARVMVRGAGNIFYALNSTNFTIQASEFVMNFAPGAANNDVCAPGTATYNFTYNTFLGFNDVTTFSASGNPAGTTVNFNPTTAQANGTNVVVTISGITTAMVGSHTIIITGTATSATQSTNINLNVYSNNFTPINLLSPANGATNISGPYTFTWQADPNAATYEIEIATDAAFTNIVDNATGLTTATYTSSTLAADTEHYWRVRPINQCGSGSFSSNNSFTTSNCITAMSTNVPVTIPNNSASIVTSTLNITTSGTINDVNVIDLIGTHSWIEDLIVTIESPQGTVVTLWEEICNSENDFDVNFDDAATPGALPCPPVGGGTYQPQDALAAFNGENPQGTWTLTVEDVYFWDGGSLNSWGLEICMNSTVVGIDNIKPSKNIAVYPNPAKGVLNISGLQNNSNVVITDVSGKTIANYLINNNQTSIDIHDFSSGVYFIRISNDELIYVTKFMKE